MENEQMEINEVTSESSNKERKSNEKKRNRSKERDSVSKRLVLEKGTPVADEFNLSSPVFGKTSAEDDETPRSTSRRPFMASPGGLPSVATTILSKQIDIISKFTLENLIELENSLIHLEANATGGQLNHFEYMTPEVKIQIKYNLKRLYIKDTDCFGGANPKDFEKWSRDELFSALKRIAPRAEGKSSGMMSIRDQISSHKLNFHVIDGVNSVYDFNDKIINLQTTYPLEVERDERQLIKIVSRNLPETNKVEKRFKSRVQVKEHQSMEELMMCMVDEAEYLTNCYMECWHYLGMVFEAPSATVQVVGNTNERLSCNGCGNRHSGRVCLLKNHPNYNQDENTPWSESTFGKILSAKGYRTLPWDKYQPKDLDKELKSWNDAPAKPVPKKNKK